MRAAEFRRKIRQLGLVFGDKGHSCKETLRMIVEHGGSPFLAFKKNASMKGLSL